MRQSLSFLRSLYSCTFLLWNLEPGIEQFQTPEVIIQKDFSNLLDWRSLLYYDVLKLYSKLTPLGTKSKILFLNHFFIPSSCSLLTYPFFVHFIKSLFTTLCDTCNRVLSVSKRLTAKFGNLSFK